MNLNAHHPLSLGFLTLILLIKSTSSFSTEMTQSTEKIKPKFMTNAVIEKLSLPFSEAVKVGHTLYLSGQLGADPKTGQLVSGGIVPETHQTMKNIQATLTKNGLNFDNLIKCTVFINDIKQWPAFNQVYRGYFKNHFPARSALGSNGLALGAALEIECIAWLP